VRVRENRVLGDRALAPTGQTELKPVTNGLGDGVAAAADDLPVFVVADDLA
jgi:hypothetical protein